MPPKAAKKVYKRRTSVRRWRMWVGREETDRKNTSPDIPGRISADAVACDDCSSWHLSGRYFCAEGRRER